jgi:tetrapyrrole methylase family protein / MazG family protein
MQQLLDELETRHAVRALDGLQLLAPAALVRKPFDPGLPMLLLPGRPSPPSAEEGFRPDVLPGRHARAADPAQMLRSLYPADHPLLGLAGTPDGRVGHISVQELEAGPRYVPALLGELNVASPHGLPWLVARLRAPDGCPWDREQDHLSLRNHLLEETYEVYDALEGGSTPALAEELGDLLLQVVLHAQYGAEAGVFDLADVQRSIMTKIIRRHPHVFADVIADSAAQVIANWEQIKAGERAAADGSGKPAQRDMPAAFAGVSRSLPALAYAQEVQVRAASLGYDWPSVEGVLEKIAEEAAEVVRAPDEHARREEFGDLLLVVVNLARRLGIDAEGALRAASAKFAARFAHVERAVASRDLSLRSMTPAELDELWQEAKMGGVR